MRRVAVATVTYGAVRLEYRTEFDDEDQAERVEASRRGAEREAGGSYGDVGQGFRSLQNEAWMMSALPWEKLGDRLVMLTWTYPGDWGRWVPDGRVWDGHRRAMAERWRRRFGSAELVGTWQKEFQGSGRPHLHGYMKVPDAVSDEDYEGLRRVTLRRKALEQKYGKWKGRSLTPPVGKEYGGEFGMWLRTAWAEVVGTQGVDKAHHAYGVNATVAFWSDGVARSQDRVAVAGYFSAEASKGSQKVPPEGFVGVGRYFGRYEGEGRWFRPVEREYELPLSVAREMETRLVRLRRAKIVHERQARGMAGAGRFDERRADTGVTVIGFRGEDFGRLLASCEDAAGRRRAERAERARARKHRE